MKKTTVLLSVLLIAGAFGSSACKKKVYNREELVALMDQYIEAIVKHDPAGLPPPGRDTKDTRLPRSSFQAPYCFPRRGAYL
jgi:hypothetical protein